MLYTPVSEAHQSVVASPPTAASNAPLHYRHKMVACDCYKLRASFGGLEPNVCGQR